MAEEVNQKQLKATFVGDAVLPVHYVNVISVRAGLEEFYFTLGTALPLEIADIKDLENIENIQAQSVCRFVVSKGVMKQMLDLMQQVYEQQTTQILTQAQEKGQEDDSDSSIPSKD